ncbi:adenylate/guanylate cyclase domain-containing protein [bacterium]|nr:adenylate/guanylate cyclase domain-containing protein [bacterium]
MKIFKGKAFFFKSIIFQIFLVLIIAVVSVNFWEDRMYDVMVNKSSSLRQGSDEIALIVIDNKSIESYRWPWARSLYGEIIDYLNKYTKAKVIVFDFIITGLDRERPESSDKFFFEKVNESNNFITGFMAQTESYKDEIIRAEYDKAFKNKFSIEINEKISKNKFLSDIISKNKFLSDIYEKIFGTSPNIYKSLTVMPKEYFKVQKYAGSVNFNLDDINAVLRSSNDLIKYNGNYYPSLTLRAYMLANNADKLTITNKNIIVDKTGLKIPVTIDQSNVQHDIKFYRQIDGKEYSHNYTPAIDIINSYRLIKQGKKPLIDPSFFDNKIVIIGGNSLATEDVLQTPISVKQPGIDVQATVLENFLQKDFMYPLSDTQNLLIILLMCIITFILIRTLSFLQSLLSILFVGVVYFIICIFAFNNNITPLVITPLAVQLSTMIFGYSYRFILEGKNKEKIQNAMGKYLSQDIMKNVVQNIDDIKLGGKKSNLTVLFSDIRGFTSMSEKMTAEEVSMILNEYFSEMEPIVTKYNGVINKFIGDAVMAIFGEPVQDINHPQNAVKCAYEMLKKVEYLREKWLFEGKPKIEIGIGINTGEAFVGNIGSQNRLEYTVIGDTVNLASRIEGYNKVYKTNLLISSSTYAQVSDMVDVIKIADVSIRGKSKKMDIYEVLKLSD